jgi:hypothetical protein
MSGDPLREDRKEAWNVAAQRRAGRVAWARMPRASDIGRSVIRGPPSSQPSRQSVSDPKTQNRAGSARFVGSIESPALTDGTDGGVRSPARTRLQPNSHEQGN